MEEGGATRASRWSEVAKWVPSLWGEWADCGVRGQQCPKAGHAGVQQQQAHAGQSMPSMWGKWVAGGATAGLSSHLRKEPVVHVLDEAGEGVEVPARAWVGAGQRRMRGSLHMHAWVVVVAGGDLDCTFGDDLVKILSGGVGGWPCQQFGLWARSNDSCLWLTEAFQPPLGLGY